METTPLGSIYLSSSPGTPVGRFDFVVDHEHGSLVQIGTLVTAETPEGAIVGSVVDMRTIGHDSNPTLVELHGSARAFGDPLTDTPEVMLATVQVFASPAMRPVRRGSVRAATAQEVLDATGYASMSWPIPAGVVPIVQGATTTYAKVCLDGEMLLGPESAHLTIGGLSGAAKTSYAGVLLKSIMSSSREGHRVGAILFNVKGTDLIYIDEQPDAGKEITDDDRLMYEVLGVEPGPFKNVTVYAPGLPANDGDFTRSARPDCVPLRWSLSDVWSDLPSLLNIQRGEDEKLDSFLAEFRDILLRHNDPGERVDTFKKLENWLDRVVQDASPETGMAWRSHHVATLRRIRRMLLSLPARAGGLLIPGASREEADIPVKGWSDGKILVVDIAGLDTQIQGMVIGRTVRRLMASASEGELGVDHMVIMADELNSFAPAQGNEMYNVKRALSVVASQGRYAGVTLVGIAQRLSKVDLGVVENAATRALGISTEIELATGLYGRLPSGTIERLSTLPKGKMALWHQAFRSNVVVNFPRPSWRGGKTTTTGAKRPTTTSVLNLKDTSLERLVEGIDEEHIERIMAVSADPEAARAALERERVPDMARSVLHEPSTFDPKNPFDLDDE